MLMIKNLKVPYLILYFFTPEIIAMYIFSIKNSLFRKCKSYEKINSNFIEYPAAALHKINLFPIKRFYC